MNLFENNKKSENNQNKPLAYRMRPRKFSDLNGQEDIIGEGKALRRAIEADCLQSIILYGPPGSGKTSLAQVIAEKTKAEFVRINAVTSGVKEIRKVIQKGKDNHSLYGRNTILFIDEIHRFNKAQQDALLPAVEEGTVTMIGATTENPYFEVNSPLLSRSQIYRLTPLKKKDITKILLNALNNEKQGLGEYVVDVEKNALDYIAKIADGDARTALNSLEMAVLTTPTNKDGKIQIDKETIADLIQQKSINYDKSGDNHYNYISAMIKSMRGSDPDASVFYLAKMLEAGEDPRFIARRVIVHAAEDVGLADPRALLMANAAARAVEFVGMPEARIPLAEAVLYIATSSKSNSTITAIDSALEFIRNNETGTVPPHLRDTHYPGADEMGDGKGYKYPHAYQNNYVDQQYLPDGLEDSNFYQPNNNGYEVSVKKKLNYLKR
jgi:putative ATPase